MPLSFKNETSNPNQTVVFKFDSPVLQFTVGLARWEFVHSRNPDPVRYTGGRIKKMRLSLETSQPSSGEIHCHIVGLIQDDDGYEMVNEDSSVTVCCIALVENSDRNLTLASVNKIPDGGESGSLTLPASSTYISQAFGTGFMYSHDNQKEVKRVHASAGFQSSGTTGQITSQAGLTEQDETKADAWINGGHVATSSGQDGLWCESVLNQQTKDPVTVSFDGPIAQALVVIQDFDLKFSTPHFIQRMAAGCSGWSIDGSDVVLDNALGELVGGYGDSYQDDDSTYISVAVFAVPE